MFGSQKYDVIHNGIDVDGFAFRPEARKRIRAELDLEPDAFVVGSVAAFLPAKNHAFVLEIFDEVVRRDAGARLLLVGSGPLEEQVREQVKKLGLENHVRFLGRRSDVPDVFCATDRLLLPSLHEGFPLVTVEAQASGLPCLISESITPEVVVSSLAQRLSLARTPSTWADALMAQQMPNDRAVGQVEVRKAGLNWSATTRKVEMLYKQCLSPTE